MIVTTPIARKLWRNSAWFENMAKLYRASPNLFEDAENQAELCDYLADTAAIIAEHIENIIRLLYAEPIQDKIHRLEEIYENIETHEPISLGQGGIAKRYQPLYDDYQQLLGKYQSQHEALKLALNIIFELFSTESKGVRST